MQQRPRFVAAALALALASGSALAQQAPPAGTMAADASAAGHPAFPPGRGRGRARMVEHLLDLLQATPAQRSRIHDLMRDAARRDRPLREQMRDLSRRNLDLLAAPTIDRGAVEALRQQRMELATRMSRAATRDEIAIAEVLTPQQRVQARDILRRRGEAMRERMDRAGERMGGAGGPMGGAGGRMDGAGGPGR